MSYLGFWLVLIQIRAFSQNAPNQASPRAGEERVPVATFSAAMKIRLRLHLTPQRGPVSEAAFQGGRACVSNAFKTAMNTAARLAPSRGELSAKLTERG